MIDELPQAPAAERNKGALLQVLEQVLPAEGLVLEIASGLGQHAAHFAQELPHLTFQPTEADLDSLAVLKERVQRLALPNLLPPLALDVLREPWPAEKAQALFNANMIHISPWETTGALFRGARTVLEPNAVMVTYGPYRVDGRHTAPSNAQFEDWLLRQDSRFGVRDLGDVEQVANQHGFVLERRLPMPANNFSIVWRKN